MSAGFDEEAASEARGPARTTESSGRNRLAAASRRLSSLLVGRPIGDAELSGVAESFEALVDQLEAAAGEGRRERELPDPTGPAQDLFATSPLIGFANPIAPPARVWAVERDDGSVALHGRVNFDYHFEGPPTCVHGGAIAALFDEMLGATNLLNDRGGMTGTLTIVYRRPTPLLADLDLFAEQTGVEGRKLLVRGTISHEGQVTAEANGIFITVDPDKMRSIFATNAAGADEELLDRGLQMFVDERPATT
jgi:acyl-coenzyme A thioesterase PaaI-like protein